MQTKPAYLILENGMVFCGKSFGYQAEASGELVFTTAMTGYLETLTDQGFYGQLVVQTFPLIGNYGVISQECESKGTSPAAYIVRDICQEPSNFRSEGALDVFLSENKIVGIYDIDTRRLTRVLRKEGTMMAKIVSELPADMDALKAELAAIKPCNAVAAVTCREASTVAPENPAHRVVLWDFGTIDSIAAELTARGCEVITVPADTTADAIAAYNPDGIVLSNGPGDPMANPAIIAEIGKLAEKKLPMFGICLGHLMLAVSQGAVSEKMLHGHRGSQPAVRTSDKRVFITSQNHGYALAEDKLPEGIETIFRNGNDGSIEGVAYKNIPAFSVQFRPGSAGGPSATDFLYDQFIDMMA
ncbi:MAG: glutamine-hydrolyzing carbamoyl-phosphate synthase small subunit [Ruminococcaceae bacterium]|nr:glutamine-hydrolyzing carbamoyl-phosphate synthase small subunit [Oscillospiraceae bacterium]